MTKKRLKPPPKKKPPPSKTPRAVRRGGGTDLAKLEARLERASSSLATVPKTRETYRVRVNELRQAAGIDYITDPDARTVEFWWNREDRPYQRTVALTTFREWATLDAWTSRRERFWLEVEERIIEAKKHEILIQRLKEVDELTEIRRPMMEYLKPLRHPDGSFVTYEDGPFQGLPKYPLELPSMEKFVRSLIDLDKHLMLKRGEATARTDTLEGVQGGSSHDPVSQKASFSKEDIRELSRFMLKMRQPELGDMAPIEIHDDVYVVEEVMSAEEAEEEDNGE